MNVKSDVTWPGSLDRRVDEHLFERIHSRRMWQVFTCDNLGTFCVFGIEIFIMPSLHTRGLWFDPILGRSMRHWWALIRANLQSSVSHLLYINERVVCGSLDRSDVSGVAINYISSAPNNLQVINNCSAGIMRLKSEGTWQGSSGRPIYQSLHEWILKE